MDTTEDAGSQLEEETPGSGGHVSAAEKEIRAVIVDGDRVRCSISHRLNQAGILIVGADDSAAIRASIRALARVEQITILEPSPPVEYGDYRKFLPRKKQRW